MEEIKEERNYKIGIILPPDINEKEKNKFLEKIKKVISELEGKVSKYKILKKKFSYPIKKLNQGIYLILNFVMTPNKLENFRKKLDLEEKVLRYLITLNPEKETQKIPVKSKRAYKKSKENLSEIDFLSKQKISSLSQKDTNKTSDKSKLDLEEVDKKIEEILKE